MGHSYVTLYDQERPLWNRMNELQDNKSAIQTPGAKHMWRKAPRTRSLRLEEQNKEQSDGVERVKGVVTA